jgi:hypothetical protein
MGNRKSTRVPDRFNREPVGLDVWQRLTRVLVVGAFAGLGVLVFSFFSPEWDKLRFQDEVNSELEMRRDALLEQKMEKLEERRRGDADREYLELIARDRLNLQLPGETIIRIDRNDEAG